MPQQLIYTSAPQGVDVGRSGYCTVARSSTMGESLVQRLEQFSYYERLSEHGGEAERTVFIFRNIDIRGKAYHVLSRIKDAPADYTGRTNFIAQHLVFTPDEVAKMPTPAVILRRWSGWKDHWEQEPRLFESESWAELDELQKRTFLPAKLWYRETGDYGRAASLIGLNSGAFAAQDFSSETILDLLSEALELLQLEGPNWRALAWQRTFSVGCQPQDNSADFRWRFLTSGLQFELAVTQGRTPQELRTLRAVSHSRQVQFATEGPVTPHFTLLPEAGEVVQRNEGETLSLNCAAESLPGEIIYRWYSVGKDNITEEELSEVYGAHTGNLTIPKLGRGKHRYKVRAWDSVSHVSSESHVMVVEVKEKISLSGRPPISPPAAPASSASKQRAKAPNALRTERTAPASPSRKEYTSPDSDNKVETPPSCDSRHRNGIRAVGVTLLILGAAFLWLKSNAFFDPKFKGRRGTTDWMHTKLFPKPEHFINDARMSGETKRILTDFITAKKNGVPSHSIDAVLLRIIGDLPNDPQPPENNPHPPQTAPIPDKKVESKHALEETPRAATSTSTRSPIYLILASNNWEAIASPIEIPLKKSREKVKVAKEEVRKADVAAKKGNPEPHKKATLDLTKAEHEVAEYTQVNTTWDNFHKRKNGASAIQYPGSWPHFKTTNGSPILTLRWALLGNTPSDTKVDGVWHTNKWSFETEMWSLHISNTNAVYQIKKQPGSVRADISMDENVDGANERVRLLLFSTDLNKPFQAKVNGDELNPTDELQTLLDNLDLKNNPLRIYGSYEHTTNPIAYNVKEVDKHGPWKLGITRQLTSETERAETLESIQNAFERLEAFWIKVKESTARQLPERDFLEAVDSGKPKEAFWKQLNRLCVVAIYQRIDDQKTPQLEAKNGEDAWKKIQEYMGKEGPDGSKFQTELQKLTEDLKHFKHFWDIVNDGKSSTIARGESYKGKSYSAARETLSKEIRALQERGTTIDPAKLRVDLQFQAWGTNWLTITRLNCH